MPKTATENQEELSTSQRLTASLKRSLAKLPEEKRRPYLEMIKQRYNKAHPSSPPTPPEDLPRQYPPCRDHDSLLVFSLSQLPSKSEPTESL